MIRGDDDGIVLPPRIAPTQIIIVPVATREESRTRIMEACDSLALQLRGKRFGDVPLEVEVDRRDIGGGVKSRARFKKAAPARPEVEPRHVDNTRLVASRRSRSVNAKHPT